MEIRYCTKPSLSEFARRVFVHHDKAHSIGDALNLLTLDLQHTPSACRRRVIAAHGTHEESLLHFLFDTKSFVALDLPARGIIEVCLPFEVLRHAEEGHLSWSLAGLDRADELEYKSLQ